MEFEEIMAEAMSKKGKDDKKKKKKEPKYNLVEEPTA